MRYAALEGLGLLSQADLVMLARFETAQAKRDLQQLETAAKTTGTTLDKDLGQPVADVDKGMSRMSGASLALAGVLAGVVLSAVNVVSVAIQNAAKAVASFVSESIELAGKFSPAWTQSVTAVSNSWDSLRQQVGNFFALSPSLIAANNSIAESLQAWSNELVASGDAMLPFILTIQAMADVILRLAEASLIAARATAQFWALMPGGLGDVGKDTVKALDDIYVGIERVRFALAQAAAAAGQAFFSSGSANNAPFFGPLPGLGGAGGAGAGSGGAAAGFGGGAGGGLGESLITVSELLAPLNSQFVSLQQNLKELRENVVGAAFDFSEFQGPIFQITETQYAMADAIKMASSAIAGQVGEYLALAAAGGKAHISLGRLLATMSSQMFATAVVELAAAIAASSGAWGRAIFGDPSAHYRAAGVFGIAGAALGAASRLAGGPGGNGASFSGGGGRGNNPGTTPTAATTAPAAMQQTVTIYLDGQGFIQDPTAFAQSLQDSLDKVNKRRGRG